MVNIGGFQNTPQNGRIEHIRIVKLAGGQRCSRFVPVPGLFTFCSKVEEQRWNIVVHGLFPRERADAQGNACTYTGQCVYMHAILCASTRCSKVVAHWNNSRVRVWVQGGYSFI